MPEPVVDLDATQLADAMRAGIYRLFEQTDHINRINVYPVPDGDTGTNLSMTMAAVLALLDRERFDSTGALLVRAADVALDGARGNSGAILSQFLFGMADAGGADMRVTTTGLTRGIAAGAAYARDALSQPREGTILTVIARFATELATAQTAGITHLSALLAAALPGVRESLESTRSGLEEMRAAGVVDAGAQGFVDWLEGFAAYVSTGTLRRVDAPVHGGDELMATAALQTDQRYCTECLIATRSGQAIDLRQLREGLGTLGSSLVVGGSKHKIRVHIHTNEPERVFECAAAFGELSGQKSDDMLRQQAASHHARSRHVAIVTDSAADMPEALLDDLDVHVVPLRVQFGNRSYLDKVSLSPEEFYRELATNPAHPKTSQPPPGDFRRTFEFLASHFDSVLSIAISSKVSGTYNAALSAAQRVGTATRVVTVLDSGNASLGQGLVVLAAAERARAGGTLAQVEQSARDAIANTITFGLLARLDYAVRGGRVPRIVKSLADLFGFAPVLANFPDGRITLGGVMLRRTRIPWRFARFIARRVARRPPGRYRVLVGHGDAPDAAQQLLAELVRQLPRGAVESSHVTTLGTALGVHGGPGMLVVGLQRLPAA